MIFELLATKNITATDKDKEYKQRMQIKTASRPKQRTVRQHHIINMPENLVRLRESPGAHKGAATKRYNETDGIMKKPFTLLKENDLIRLQQIVETEE